MVSNRRRGERVPQTVLIIEDEVPVLKLVTALLRNSGREVLSAVNGAQALEIARTHEGPIDMVISNVLLSGQKGPEIVRELLAMRPAVPCLFVSGFPQENPDSPELQEIRRIPSARVGFLAKPFKPAELLAAVEALSRS